MVGPRASASASASGTVPADRAQISLSFAPVVRSAAPAVVSVTSRKQVEVRRDLFAGDPFFRHFFRDFGSPARQREQSSLGSGVLVRGDGLIVTNNHVIDGADEIRVILQDRREFPAHVVSADDRADLAFLQIDGETGNLPVLPLGDSDRIEVGDLVLAIGNPFGIGQTVTSGIVSAKSRISPGVDREVSFIQTDAAINPGNSGGALVGVDGSLVGINTAIFTRGTGGSIGIGFAIPANLVRAQILSIDSQGTVRRPWLGAAVQMIDPGLASALGLDRPVGVLVNRVYPGGSAERASLRERDVIVAVNGVEVYDLPGLNLRLALQPMGEKVRVRRWRDGRLIDVELNVEPAPREPAPDETLLEGRHPLDGLSVANMSPAFNEEIGIDMFDQGVVVVTLKRRGYASRLRLQAGDEIVAVNGENVGNVRQLKQSLEREHRQWKLTIRRGGQDYNLTVAG
ncbi:MAG: Do family serine endopeptidase [Geminicoccaceae bacterium]|nr:Do family serine endopeptidase [Geminicoccaceae bacterium]